MDFNWKQYISNYPDLQEAGIIREEEAIAHYNRFGKNENRTFEKYNIPITIITPCKNQENLKHLKESINFEIVCEWIIVYDAETKDFLFDDPKISEYTHFNELSVYGNAQRNYGISKIKNENSFIYFLDDDNLVHPGLFNLSLIPNKNYSFNQENGHCGKHIKLNEIDTAMVLLYYPLIKGISWVLDQYNADGLFIQECYKRSKHYWSYIPKELCYYNKLVKIDTFKGYSDLKNSQHQSDGKIPKLIFKSSWYTRDSMHPEIKKVLQKTINLNPGYTVYYFDDTEMEQFMGDYDPTFRCLRAFKKLVPGAFKCDLWRYCILEKYGGCYSDIGHILKVSFDNICESHSLVLVQEIKNLGIHNGLICCTPGHLLMKLAIQQTLYNIENGIYGENDVCITGPKMLENVYKPIYLETPVKMLRHYISREHKKYIRDLFDNELIITKFDNYDSIMYPPGKLDYHILWKNKQVFR